MQISFLVLVNGKAYDSTNPKERTNNIMGAPSPINNMIIFSKNIWDSNGHGRENSPTVKPTRRKMS